MNELATIHSDLPQTVEDIRQQINLIQDVMAKVMKKDVHYGKIPGCGDKPTLLKAGAEKIMATFRLAADPVVEDLSTKEECRFRVTVKMTSPSGRFVGSGIGECSSSEEKYKWRSAVCDDEWQEADESKRRKKWRRGAYGKPPYQMKQVRTETADVSNTVLKMAKKRALMDAVLTATAASDIFSQDLEDMPEEIRETAAEDTRPRGVKDMEKEHPKKKEIFNKLEIEARKGWDALQKAWRDTSKEDREIVGADFKRLKDIAES